jgi:phage-related baseplate assembly protein
MPSNFGRVYRAGFRPNPVNPLSTLMYVVSRNSSGQLVLSSDTLKINLSKYLNEFRLISDAIDIVDAAIVNIRVKYTVTLNSSAVKNTTLQKINQTLKDYFNIKNFQIDQGILTSDIMNILLNTDGVTTVSNLTFESVNGVVNGTAYSDVVFNVTQNTLNGVIVPPPGGIFEVRYPDFDIIGNVS